VRERLDELQLLLLISKVIMYGTLQSGLIGALQLLLRQMNSELERKVKRDFLRYTPPHRGLYRGREMEADQGN
jgi:hypothetical protein